MRLRPGWAPLPGPGAGTADQRRSPWLSGQDRPWTWPGSRARLASVAGPGGARHVMVAEADRRVARARSRTTAAVAATRAAPTAIKVICQPAMPPANTGTVAGGTSRPPGVMGMLAEAAGMMAAEASRPQVRAARAAVARRSRAAACRAAARG